MNLEQSVALARFTTLGTGGPAAAFARPETLEELQEALAWAVERESPVATVGLGSNLLVADEGFAGLVLKLGGELAEATVEGERLLAGGGAANAVCLHRVRAAGLGGFEFACAIPGTIGGGVWMNAGAYGSDWATILDRALVVDADGARWSSPEELGLELPALRSSPRAGRRASGVHALAAAGGADQGERRAPPGPAQGRATHEQTDLRERLQEPRARADRGPDARGLRTEGLPDRRSADLSASRELHRERGRSTDGRRNRAHGRGPKTRARAIRRRATARGRVPRPARAPAARVGAPTAAAKAASCPSAGLSVREPAQP